MSTNQTNRPSPTMYEYIAHSYRNMMNFQGRSTRRNLIYFLLWMVLLNVISFPIFQHLGTIAIIAMIALQFPVLSIISRRLQDVGMSPAWMLAILLPAIGGALVLIFCLLPGQKFENEYGPDPRVTEGRI